MVRSIKNMVTIAGGVLLAWFVVQLVRFLVYAYWGLTFWEWDWELWWSNEVHRVFDYFMYN